MSNPIMTDMVDVQGVEDDATPFPITVPVHQEGPIHTEPLPSRLGDARTVTVLPASRVTAHNAGEATLRINADPRRRKMILLSTDQPFYYGMEQQSVESGSAALWPINVALVVEHTDQFFLASANAAGTTLSIIREYWSL